MLTFLSVSSIIYLLYLYNYDKPKLDNLYKCLHNFSNNTENTKNTENTENTKNTKNTKNTDIEIGIADEYDMTDQPIDSPNNIKDYYDKSLSTYFVEKLPIINRFYSFTKKKENHDEQTT